MTFRTKQSEQKPDRDERDRKPADTQKPAPGQKPEIDPQTGEAKKSPEQTNFEENLQKSRDELVDRIEKLKSDKLSIGSSQLGERANLRMQALFQKQIDEIDALFDRAKQDFATRTSLQSVSMDVLASQLKKEAETAAGAKVENFEKTVNRNTKPQEYITTEDVYNIEVALLGAEKALQNPKVAPILKKLQESQELSDADYQAIIQLLDPNQIWTGEQDSYEKSFEATIAGSLIHLMRPDQKFVLVEQYMNSKKDGVKLLDTFLSTGVITRDQAEIAPAAGNNPARPSLFQIAIDKGLLTREEYQKTYAPKFTNNTYEQNLAEIKRVIQSQQLKDFSGQYQKNVMERLVGMPLVGGIVAAWGAIFLTMNILANRKNLGEFLGTPQAVAGVTGLLGGLEVATGAMQQGTGSGIGAGIISSAIDNFSTPSDAERKDLAAKNRLTEIYRNSSPLLRQYLDSDGYATLKAIRDQKEKDGKTDMELISFNLNELIAYEKLKGSKDRAALLEQMQSGTKGKPQDFESKLTAVSEIALNLDFGEKDHVAVFTQVIKDIRVGNRPGAAAA